MSTHTRPFCSGQSRLASLARRAAAATAAVLWAPFSPAAPAEPARNDHFEVLHAFSYAVDDRSGGAAPEVGLTLLADGTVLGTTEAGGLYGYGGIFAMNEKGRVRTLHSFYPGWARGVFPSPVTLGPDGSLYGTTYLGPGEENYGSTYRLAPDGSFTTLNIFSSLGDTGALPHGGLLLASDGAFYGAAGSLSDFNWSGSVFRMTTAGQITPFYNFRGYPEDGAVPEGGLLEASDGHFYVNTSWGGRNNVGTVTRIAHDGSAVVLHSFVRETDGAFPSGGLIQGSDGALYGVATNGGPGDAGTVFRLALDGQFSVLHAFVKEGGLGVWPSGGLVQASDGMLYGVTHRGGRGRAGTVFRVGTSGGLELVHAFTMKTEGRWPAGPLVQSRDGRLLGTTNCEGSFGAGSLFAVAAAANPPGDHARPPRDLDGWPGSCIVYWPTLSEPQPAH